MPNPVSSFLKPNDIIVATLHLNQWQENCSFCQLTWTAWPRFMSLSSIDMHKAGLWRMVSSGTHYAWLSQCQILHRSQCPSSQERLSRIYQCCLRRGWKDDVSTQLLYLQWTIVIIFPTGKFNQAEGFNGLPHVARNYLYLLEINSN